MAQIKELIFEGDRYRMNWLRDDYAYGEALVPEGLAARAEHRWENGMLESAFYFKNVSGKPFFSSLASVGIRLPLQDKYESSQICITGRCHTHLFCGGNVSYVCAYRMGGEAPHLGLVLTEGSLGGYSVERDLAKMSNDRGCFILHPSPFELQPGEELKLSWKIFSHEGEADFFEKAGKLTRFIRVNADKYVLFPGEGGEIKIEPSWEAKRVTVNGEAAQWLENGVFAYHYGYGREQEYGDREFVIEADGVRTGCRILLHEAPEILADRRCHFIAEHQQYHAPDGEKRGLDGAYLVYDNEEKHLYYNIENDYNAGRERAGMGLLMTARLRGLKARGAWDIGLAESLDAYRDFVLRELVDVETGQVFDDFGRDERWKRLYNSPWYATLCTEWYALYGKTEYLTYACRIVRWFYEKGGFVHYSIEMPILSLCRELKKAGMEEELREMTGLFVRHADSVMEIGVNYPPFEVNYEQSIIAPAANILLQVYFLTKEKKYLEAGRMQLSILELFNGHQPDYHRYETAIRHWDGYWFGKRRTYGDTFPHYWSGLTGSCFALYYAAAGEKEYAARAKASLRGVLSMIFPDGTASCACVFPVTVNGKKPDGWDAYANDQDWALYFYIRMQRELEEVLR